VWKGHRVVVDKAQVSRGRRGPYAKSKQTRQDILDCALRVFAESGYRSGSLREVAEQVGMSEAGLLHHFASKKALLRAVLERRDEQTRAQFDFDGTDDPRQILRATIALVQYNASTPGVVELFCTLSAEATAPSHPAHQYFVDRYADTTAVYRDVFEHLGMRGELREGVDPAGAARGVIALMDGLQIQWLLDRDSVDMAADVRTYLASLVVGEI
jgi:AcrR family transcriptional regulator